MPDSMKWQMVWKLMTADGGPNKSKKLGGIWKRLRCAAGARGGALQAAQAAHGRGGQRRWEPCAAAVQLDARLHPCARLCGSLVLHAGSSTSTSWWLTTTW